MTFLWVYYVLEAGQRVMEKVVTKKHTLDCEEARVNHDLNYWLMNTLIRRLHANFLAAWNRPASRDSQRAEKDHRSLKSLLLTEKCDCKRLTRWKWKEVPGGAEHLNTSHLKALSNLLIMPYSVMCVYVLALKVTHSFLSTLELWVAQTKWENRSVLILHTPSST